MDPFPDGTHICYLFEDDHERKCVLSALVQSSIRNRYRVDYLADVDTQEQLEQTSREFPLPVGASQLDDQLRFAVALDTHCPDGTFVPGRMLSRVREAGAGAANDGWAGARIISEMTWALRGASGSEQLIAYEASLNALSGPHGASTLCQYDVRRFDGSTLFDVLTTHPRMIIRGQVVGNPYFVASTPCVASGSNPRVTGVV